MGLFAPDERLELIGGEVVVRMTPQSSQHAAAVRLVEEALRRAFASGFDVRVQLPLALGSHSEPEPDVCVVPGTVRDYERRHPSSAVLVVEVSDSTLAFDRTVKGSLYALAGIPEYWVVSLAERVVDVHRAPAPMEEHALGYHYLSVTRCTNRDVLAPSSAPEMHVAVRDLLPLP